MEQFKLIRNFIIKYCSDSGVPVILLRDPKTGKGSVSLTLVFISFNIWLLSILGHASSFFGGIDVNQTFNMVLACFGLYFSRNFKAGTTKLEISGDSNEKQDLSKDFSSMGMDLRSETDGSSEAHNNENCTCKKKKRTSKRD